jgi:hypothetical protein
MKIYSVIAGKGSVLIAGGCMHSKHTFSTVGLQARPSGLAQRADDIYPHGAGHRSFEGQLFKEN